MFEVWYQAPDWVTTNPLVIALWGLGGGVLVALALRYLHRRARARETKAQGPVPVVSIGAIDFSHLQVVGLGGFALVVMCAMVAIAIPPIGIPLGIGVLLAITGAVVAIVRRRRAGPVFSSEERPGANTTLRIDD